MTFSLLPDEAMNCWNIIHNLLTPTNLNFQRNWDFNQIIRYKLNFNTLTDIATFKAIQRKESITFESISKFRNFHR